MLKPDLLSEDKSRKLASVIDGFQLRSILKNVSMIEIELIIPLSKVITVVLTMKGMICNKSILHIFMKF